MKKSTSVVLALTAVAVAAGVVEGVRRFLVEMNEVDYGYNMCDEPDCCDTGSSSVKHQESTTSETAVSPENVTPIRSTSRPKNADDAVFGDGFLVEL
jgi:hypothetical protein